MPKIDITKIAKLANLPIGKDQKKVFGEQLAKILDYVDQIEKANTKETGPTYNVSPNINAMRKDNPAKSLTQKEALQNASNSKNGQFVTKGVFEEKTAAQQQG